MTLRQRTLDSAMRNVGKLKAAVDKCKATDASRLRAEYDRLIGGLQARPPPAAPFPKPSHMPADAADAVSCLRACIWAPAPGRP